MLVILYYCVLLCVPATPVSKTFWPKRATKPPILASIYLQTTGCRLQTSGFLLVGGIYDDTHAAGGNGGVHPDDSVGGSFLT